MKSRAIFSALILAAAAGALAFRLPQLSRRPMHGDEAVQARKSGDLFEHGVYRYDPDEFHGPTLYYLSLIPMRLTSARTLADTDEATFRIVPVAFGVALILLLLLFGDGLGRPAAVCAAALTAVSPAFVYYSRYYIQEPLLVFFTFATIVFAWRYAQSRRIGWAMLTGASLALMHATKETCIIAFGSMLLALALVLGWKRWISKRPVRIGQVLPIKHLIAAAAVGGIVSVTLFSSFFTNWRGPWDSIATYASYLHRAGSGLHIHPWWHYYLGMLLYTKLAPGPWWSEGLIVALAVVGFVVAMLKRSDDSGSADPIRFVAFYTLIMTAAYSKIPYKTPWCMLSFLHGMILLAGVGAVAIVRRMPTVPAKAAVAALLAAGTVQLAWQAHAASFRFYADNRNPYVYSHPVNDVFNLIERVEDIARIHPDGRGIVVKVIAPHSDYWPIPWYLRRFTQVGYWDAVPADPDAPVIIAAADAQLALQGKLRDKYQVNHYGLRPHAVLLLYIRSDLWEEFIKRRAEPRMK
ncbi:MAG: flippase activity-associated protein Agl23 [Planctomycetota bacterium]